jgi:transcriptional regulator with XRE-family HTH domain
MRGILIWECSRMQESEALFFKELGQRMAELRSQRGMTQAQLADSLELKQQVIASYETGRRRPPASLLPSLARVLGVSVEELLGQAPPVAKRGPAPKLQRQVEMISRLPKAKQRLVSQLLDTILNP